MTHLKKTKTLCLLLVCSLLAALPATGVFTAEAVADDTELATQMEEMQAQLKKLRKTVKDPAQNKESLEILAKFQQATLASKSQTPAKAKNVPEAERAKFLAGYRKEMAMLLQHLLQIEVAIVDGDNAKAEELFKGLKQIEDDGHEKYSEE